MIELIGLVVALIAGIASHRIARRYVRTRLRFVDDMQRPAAPWIAGTAAALIAAPVVLLLPLVGAGTTFALAIGTGLGVARGAKDVRLASYHLDAASIS